MGALIGVDASRASEPQPTGTEVYSAAIIRSLLALPTNDRFRLYTRHGPGGEVGASDRLEWRRIGPARLWTHAGLGPETLRHPPDVLFVPAHTLPIVFAQPSVVTVHDLGFLRFPAEHPHSQRAYLRWSHRFVARVATRLIAVSERTRADLIDAYDAPPERIRVVRHGGGERLRPASAEDIAGVRQRRGLHRPYLLFVGTLQPRKNLVRLIRAYARAGLAASHDLVLAGKKGWLTAEIEAQPAASGVRDTVRFIGRVPDDELGPLYSGADVFCFPSLYEGFGLPVIEAMACGAPVLTSGASALAEVGADAALLVDPLDEDDIATGLVLLTRDRAARAQFRERGLVRARSFTWERCARETRAVLREAMGWPRGCDT